MIFFNILMFSFTALNKLIWRKDENCNLIFFKKYYLFFMVYDLYGHMALKENIYYSK